MCRCYQHGSEDNICNDSNGKCDCMTGYSGDKCYACQVCHIRKLMGNNGLYQNMATLLKNCSKFSYICSDYLLDILRKI